MSLTLYITVITVAISIIAMYNEALMDKLIFHPYTYLNHFKQYNYNSLGASGAVSAIVFAGIFLQPTLQIGFFIIPPIIPGFIFGPIYLGITAYLSKNGQSGINHSAHLWGSIYGVVFLIITSYFMGNYNVLAAFMEQIRIYLAR